MHRDLSELFIRTVVEQVKPKKNLKRALGGKFSAFVLITCTKPDRKGNMDVELVYEGDRDLASYLIHTAQGLL